MQSDDRANDEWYCKVFGTEFGPLPAADVRRMVETEQLSADDLVRAGYHGRWQPVGEVADLRMLLKQVGSQPPPTAIAPVAVELPDEWYYQLDGRVHGPLTQSALVDLIGSSGDTARDVVVRQQVDGPWMPFNSLPGVAPSTASPATIQRGDRSGVTAYAASRGSGRSPARSIRQFMRDHRDLAIGLAVWLLINGILVAWPQSYSTERRYFATLRSLEAETKELQARDASVQDWAAFRERVKQTLAPMVADLKKKASASEPIRQHLLWAARDQFPKCVGPRTREKSETERLYQGHMRVIEQEFAKQ